MQIRHFNIRGTESQSVRRLYFTTVTKIFTWGTKVITIALSNPYTCTCMCMYHITLDNGVRIRSPFLAVQFLHSIGAITNSYKQLRNEKIMKRSL